MTATGFNINKISFNNNDLEFEKFWKQNVLNTKNKKLLNNKKKKLTKINNNKDKENSNNNCNNKMHKNNKKISNK